MIKPEEFRLEVMRVAKEMNAEIKEIHIKPMKTKWASCSINGRVTFDSTLLDQPEEFRKEVIVHELLHLTVPSHGRMFKVMMKSYRDL